MAGELYPISGHLSSDASTGSSLSESDGVLVQDVLGTE